MTLDSSHSGASRRRALALGVVVTVGGAAASWLLLRWSVMGFISATAAGTVPVSQGFPVLIGVAAGLTCGAVSWLGGLGVVALTRTPHTMNARVAGASPVSPRWGARAAAVLLTLSLSAPAAHATTPLPSATTFPATVAVAAASPANADDDTDLGSPPIRSLPGWSPTSPALPGVEGSGEVLPSTSVVRAEPTDGVVVTRGDTLWDIAASALGPGATNASIAAHWPSWHEANRQVIGPNPHLLLPGQILQPPSHSGAQP